MKFTLGKGRWKHPDNTRAVRVKLPLYLYVDGTTFQPREDQNPPYPPGTLMMPAQFRETLVHLKEEL